MNKRHYSYFIIKPDGMRYVKEITSNIESQFESILYYSIDNFSDIIKKLYYKHFQKESFEKSFSSYLYGLNEIFGNKGVLILVGESRIPYEDFVKKVFETKLKIRTKFENNNLGIATNYGDAKTNYIKLISTNGKIESPRILNSIGNHRISNLNIIHSPDADIHTSIAELNILFSEGIITDYNLLTPQMLQNIKEYKTAEFINDMKKTDYKGVITPNLSGFIKSNITETSKDLDISH